MADELPPLPKELRGRKTEARAREPSLRERMEDRFFELFENQGNPYHDARNDRPMVDYAATATDMSPLMGMGVATFLDDAYRSAPSFSGLWKEAKGWLDGEEAPEQTYDEFMKERVSALKPENEFVTAEQDKVRQSKGFTELGRREQDRRLASAARTAKETYKTYVESQPRLKEEAETAWKAKLGARDEKRKKELSKGFAERNPQLAKLLPLAGLAASFLFGKYGLNKINKEGQEIATRFAVAQKRKDYGKMASIQEEADHWAKTELTRKAGTIAKASMAPVVGRGVGDAVDIVALPEDAPAREAALDRVSNVPEYLAHSLPAVLEGASVAGIGAGLRKTISPRGRLNSIRSYGTEASPDVRGVKMMQDAANLQSVRRDLGASELLPIGRAQKSQTLRPLPEDRPEPILGQTGDQTRLPVRQTKEPQQTRLPKDKSDQSGPKQIGSSSQTPKPRAKYGDAERDIAAKEVAKILRAVPADKRSSYNLDAGAASDSVRRALEASGIKPPAVKTLKSKAGKTAQAMENVRASGGDPFSKSGRRVLRNTEGALAVPLALTTAAALTPEDDFMEEGFASGGEVLPRLPERMRAHSGPLHSTVAGRTDHLPLNVASGSYVIPADVVSALGEGNTAAGMEIIKSMFPEDERMTRAYASGGSVPIMAAGGEHVLSPGQVAAIGGGDLGIGHETLDQFVKQTRAETINTLKRLPGPER